MREIDDWHARSACQEVDAEMFFIPIRRSQDPREAAARTLSEQVEARAKQICISECPVRAQCLGESYALGDLEGIRGGYNGRERKRLFAEYRKKRLQAGPGPGSGAAVA